MANPQVAKEKEVMIRKGAGKPDAHPEKVPVPSDGKVTWILDTDADRWVVLMDGKTPFVGRRSFFSGQGKGSRAGAKIDTDRVKDGEEFKYWIFWRDAAGDVQYADPRIVIDDLP